MNVAVIIPLFNGAAWIEDTLNSVYSQQQLPAEVIVVDDGSTDGSREIVSTRFSATKLMANIGKGSSHARNVGIENSRSPLLAFLDQDDLWHPSHLKMLSEISVKNPVNCVVATADCFSGEVPSYSPSPQPAASFDPWERFPFTMGIEGPSVAIFKRDFLASAGNWQVEGTGMGDILLFLKAAVLKPILSTASVTVGKRVHAQQQWLKVRNKAIEYMRCRMAVTRIALDFRQATLKDDSYEKFERNWEALEHLTQLVDSMQCGNYKTIAEIAGNLELTLDKYSARQAFYCLMGALFPIYDASELKVRRDDSFETLLSHWPTTTPVTRAVLSSMIGEDPIVS
jgi:hypothetical protein